ncbi:hypothetical protein PIROE2DRAFT_15656 [Piromyces sp. E2]|nr:hypothetical protein PIROE2DRAFT_15656 [Piromyces sp. E2]|eukprot:OUM58946.1 hypothetical protein PIROE2DRAFT_15656 [Piromyces sp. E2]
MINISSLLIFLTSIGITFAEDSTSDKVVAEPKISETTKTINKFTYLVYPLLLILLFWGSKPFGLKKWNEEALSLKQMKAIQGFISLCIMFHHIGQRTCANWLPPEKFISHGLDFFVPIGYCFVAIFFFCSGYGLYLSFHKKQNYLDGFFKKRVFIVILSYYTSGYIFLALRFIMRQQIDSKLLLYYLIGVKMSNPHAWFVVVMPLLYLFFYLSFRFCKKDGRAVLSLFLCVIVYIMLCSCINHGDWIFCGEWWYNSVIFLPLGVLFSKYQKAIVNHLKHHFTLYYVYTVLAFAGVFLIHEISLVTVEKFSYYGEVQNYDYVAMRRWICAFSQICVAIAFISIVFLVSMKILIGNRFLGFMGTITLEFYLIHGIFLEPYFDTLAPPLYEIKNVPLLILIVFIPAIIAAVLLKKFHQWILSMVNPKKTATHVKNNDSNGADSKIEKDKDEVSQKLTMGKESSEKNSNDCIVELVLDEEDNDDDSNSQKENTKENIN